MYEVKTVCLWLWRVSGAKASRGLFEARLQIRGGGSSERNAAQAQHLWQCELRRRGSCRAYAGFEGSGVFGKGAQCLDGDGKQMLGVYQASWGLMVRRSHH